MNFSGPPRRTSPGPRGELFLDSFWAFWVSFLAHFWILLRDCFADQRAIPGRRHARYFLALASSAGGVYTVT